MARQMHIIPGMPISEATSLAYHASPPSSSRTSPPSMAHANATASSTSSHEPSLRILDHDLQEDLDALCWLVDAAQQFSPIVGLESIADSPWAGRSVLQPQCLLMDITHLASLFGGEQAMATEVQQWLMAKGYCGCIAIAESVGASWALANYALRAQASQTLLAYNRLTQPASITTSSSEPPQPALVFDTSRIPPQIANADANDFDNLPIESLRLTLSTTQALHRLGVRNLHDLRCLPREGIASRLGKEILMRLDQLYEAREEPIPTLQANPDFSVTITLEHPTHHQATLQEILRRLTQELCLRLEKKGCGALRMVCRFDGQKVPPHLLQLGLYHATAETSHLQRLLLGQLEQTWSRPLAVHRVTLQATLTGELTWQQPELFESNPSVKRDAIARLVDGLSCRLGRTSVVAPQLHRDPQPERAFHYRPLTGRRNDGKPQITSKKLSRLPRQAEPSPEDPLRRPLTLGAPKPIQVIAVEGMPQELCYQHRLRGIARVWGPERIESGWWRGPSQCRDYFRIETEDGYWLWIYFDRHQHAWFLHGEFD